MWKTAGCAVQGRGHVKADIPCQDKFFCVQSDSVSVIALADGAGSAPLSHHGADAVTSFICQDFVKNFDAYYTETDGAAVKITIMEKLLKNLKNISDELGCDLKHLASTLLLAAVKDDKFIVLHIGDGVIGYMKDGEIRVASVPDNGEFANTTVFTTSSNAVKTMRLIKGSLGSISGFVLMSDGTENSMYDKRRKSLSEAVKKLMEKNCLYIKDRMKEKLEDCFENTIKQLTTDDCSIAMMTDISKMPSRYTSLSEKQKKDLLQLEVFASKRTYRRYDSIIKLLDKPRSIKHIARRCYLKPAYVKKHLAYLMEQGIIEKTGDSYIPTLSI